MFCPLFVEYIRDTEIIKTRALEGPFHEINFFTKPFDIASLKQ